MNILNAFLFDIPAIFGDTLFLGVDVLLFEYYPTFFIDGEVLHFLLLGDPGTSAKSPVQISHPSSPTIPFLAEEYAKRISSFRNWYLICTEATNLVEVYFAFV